MNMNERMNTLTSAGIDTRNYFTLLVNEDIPAGSRLSIEVVKPNTIQTANAVQNASIVRTVSAPIAPAAPTAVEKAIEMDGYVKNSKIHRRWITAQYMRMLNSSYGWREYFNKFYAYSYQLTMMTDEVKSLYKLQTRDRETFRERSQFFTMKTVRQIVKQYAADVYKFISGLHVYNHNGNEFLFVPGIGRVDRRDLDTRIFNPIDSIVSLIQRSYSYKDMYNLLCSLQRVYINLPHDYRKIPAFVNAFQLEGAYYTLRNLIMFHDVKLVHEDVAYGREESLTILKTVAQTYQGYQLHAMLKKTIEWNHFDFKQSIRDSKRK